MAASPIILMFVLICSFIFQAALFGEEYAADSFGGIDDITDECPAEGIFGDGIFAAAKCAIAKTVQFFKTIGGVISFFWKLISFDIPGAPWYVRALLSTMVTGGMLWSIVTLFRGN